MPPPVAELRYRHTSRRHRGEHRPRPGPSRHPRRGRRAPDPRVQARCPARPVPDSPRPRPQTGARPRPARMLARPAGRRAPLHHSNQEHQTPDTEGDQSASCPLRWGRDRCPLRCPLDRLRPVPILDDARSHPLPDEPQDSLVRNAMLEEPLHPPGSGSSGGNGSARVGTGSSSRWKIVRWTAHRSGCGSASISCHDCPGKRTWRSLTKSPRLGELLSREHRRVIAWPRISLDARRGDTTPDLTPEPPQLGLQPIQLSTGDGHHLRRSSAHVRLPSASLP